MFFQFYGQSLEGQPFFNPGVAAKPLRIGVVYSVNTEGSGSGYGSGRFRIRADRTIENLSIDGGELALAEQANGS